MAESAKANKALTSEMGEITKITLKSTKWVKAGTARVQRIAALPIEKRPPKQLAESRRSAREMDKTTKKMASRIPLLAAYAKAYSQAELGFWRWHTANHHLGATVALSLISKVTNQLNAIKGFLAAQAESKIAVAKGRGISQAKNEAIDRRLIVIDRLCEAVASQQAPLLEVISLIEPHAGMTTNATDAPPSSAT